MLCGNYILSNRSEWNFYFLSSVQFNFTIGEGFNIGKTLLNAAENELKKMGYGKIYLWCIDGDENARQFFEHFGWINNATEKFVEIAGKEYKYLLYQKNLHD